MIVMDIGSATFTEYEMTQRYLDIWLIMTYWIVRLEFNPFS